MVGTRKSKKFNATYSQVPAEDLWNRQKEAEEEAAAAGTDNDDEKSEAETHVNSVLNPTADEEEIQFVRYKDPPIPLDGNDNPSQMMPGDDDLYFEEPVRPPTPSREEYLAQEDQYLEEQYQYFSQDSTEKRNSFEGVEALLKEESEDDQYEEEEYPPMPPINSTRNSTNGLTLSENGQIEVVRDDDFLITAEELMTPVVDTPPRNSTTKPQPIINPYLKKKKTAPNSTNQSLPRASTYRQNAPPAPVPPARGSGLGCCEAPPNCDLRTNHTNQSLPPASTYRQNAPPAPVPPARGSGLGEAPPNSDLRTNRTNKHKNWNAHVSAQYLSPRTRIPVPPCTRRQHIPSG